MSLPRREWFQPGEGIAREVISADIQRYLGRDATVRPGTGVGEDEGIPGYWITAHRNLTTAQVEDLKRDSLSWHNERTSRDVSYPNSSTFQYSRQQQAHHADPPPRQEYTHPPAQSSYSYPGYQQPTESQPAYSYQQSQAASGYYQGNQWVQSPGYSQTPASQAPRTAVPYSYTQASTPGHTAQQSAAAYSQYNYPQQAYVQQPPASTSSAYSHGQQPSTQQYYQDPRTAQTSAQSYQYQQQQQQQQQQQHPSYTQQGYQYQQQPPAGSSRRR